MSDSSYRDRAYAKWRDAEVDERGSLPDIWGAFNAGWESALSAASHDHILDGHSYRGCRACAVEIAITVLSSHGAYDIAGELRDAVSTNREIRGKELIHAIEIILSNWGDFPNDAERDRRTLTEIDKLVNPLWHQNGDQR